MTRLRYNWIKRSLKVAIITSLTMSFTTVVAAYSEAVVYSKDGKPMFDVVFADKGEISTLGERSPYALSGESKIAIGKGLQYWADILGPQSLNNKPTQVLVGTTDKANAYAVSYTNMGNSGSLYIAQGIQGTKDLQWIDIKNLETVDDKSETGAFTNIIMGKYLGSQKNGCENGWYIDDQTPLPENEQAADFIGTVRHEMGHALGIGATIVPIEVPGTKPTEHEYYFVQTSLDKNSWEAHLFDQNGNQAKAGMQVVTSDTFENIQGAKKEDYFILDEGKNAYFVGKNVTETLNGATFDGVNGLPVNGWEGGSPELSHLQTTGMMSHRSYSNYTNFMEVELAVMQDLGYKIDRKNFFGYSVYADGQTIVNTKGYAARNADGTAYLAGVYNATALGVGLHVYGANNNIIQAADILTVGNGAVGMRIDGNENTITLNKDNMVHADGYRGIGVLVAYGSGHELTQNGTVTADGAGGVGVRFDFGSSSNGSVDEYRGSYIRYIRETEKHKSDGSNDYDASDGTIVSANNADFDSQGDGYHPATPELNGALINNYNLNGDLSGSQQAILIGKNAFVDNINIGDGAFIRGDIKSEWKQFATDEGIYDGDGVDREMLKIRYDGYLYDYDDYIPDLVTNLNFNANITYAGIINGKDNMRLNINSKVLEYSGTADIIGVEVAAGADLYGGNYTVNRQHIKNTQVTLSSVQSNLLARTANAEDNTGNFVSQGSIGALNHNGKIIDMQITAVANGQGDKGNFLADGQIRFTAQNEQIGQIKINNFNDVQLGQNSGLQLTFDRDGLYLPDHTYNAKQIVSVDGIAQDIIFSGADSYRTGLLSTSYDANGIYFQVTDNLGARDNRQQIMLNTIEGIRSSLSNLNADYAPLYNLSATQVKSSLTDIYGGMQADLATAAQKDRYLTETVLQASKRYNQWQRPSLVQHAKRLG